MPKEQEWNVFHIVGQCTEKTIKEQNVQLMSAYLRLHFSYHQNSKSKVKTNNVLAL